MNKKTAVLLVSCVWPLACASTAFDSSGGSQDIAPALAGSGGSAGLASSAAQAGQLAAAGAPIDGGGPGNAGANAVGSAGNAGGGAAPSGGVGGAAAGRNAGGGGVGGAGGVRTQLPESVVYASLGDSITNGWNAGVTCQDWPSTPQPFPTFCGDGNSYVVDVARGLTAAGHQVSVVNPAQPSKRIGYVIKVELAEVPVDATLVSLYIGTNDWRDIANAGSEPAVVAGIARFKADFDGVLVSIAKKAPGASVVLLNVPNQKFVNEGHAPDELERFDRVSNELNHFINSHAERYAIIDNACDARTYDKAFRGSNVHPNTAGHQLIAERIVAATSGMPAPLPAASCAPYLTP